MSRPDAGPAGARPAGVRPPGTRPPGPSMRLRLTLSYAAFVVVVGAALFAVGFLLLRFVPEGNLVTTQGGAVPTRGDLLDVFVRYAAWALAALAVIGLGGGWLLAGRMLRPLARITDVARRTRDGSLDGRIRLPGRRDELTDLADAFDAMLDRVQRSVDEQRRFAAAASHELRTPLAVTRTLLEVARADPSGRDVDRLLDRLALTNERSITLTEALLDLAHADEAERPPGLTDLAPLAADVVAELGDQAARARVSLTTDLVPGPVHGDAALLRQLVANLLQNAVVHNAPGGTVRVATTACPEDGTLLTVTNTGPRVDPDAVPALLEAFARGTGRTRTPSDHHVGSGLGLALVASVARAHGAVLRVTARPEGGLHVSVAFPPADAARGVAGGTGSPAGPGRR